nr:protein SIEVE ELEMENT OCCLUSION B-like [Ipomoea batatas]
MLIMVQQPTKVRIVWIPIFDYLELWAIKQMEEQYGMLAKGLEWVSVINPHKSVASCFVRFVKEKLFPTFQIGGDPIIMSLDRHERIVHHNAMHTILMRTSDISQGINTRVEIGDSIIPLLQNVLKERTLAVRGVVPNIDTKLDQIAGNMERVMIEGLDEIGKQIQNPALDDENELCILIGENNIKWVKTFLSTVLSKICFNPLQRFEVKMFYIGSNMKVASMVDDEFKIFDESDEALNLSLSRIFWSRLQNIFLSRIKFLDETHGGSPDLCLPNFSALLVLESSAAGGDTQHAKSRNIGDEAVRRNNDTMAPSPPPGCATPDCCCSASSGGAFFVALCSIDFHGKRRPAVLLKLQSTVRTWLQPPPYGAAMRGRRRQCCFFWLSERREGSRRKQDWFVRRLCGGVGFRRRMRAGFPPAALSPLLPCFSGDDVH